ncbi:hypothetical protein L6452_01169 [Arctium lappa]|uniref:Uncharacterized protein n=1 Tax=Arctium lappa TaxID=4217 RepID=A0ACB9FFD5_ARCLA|nr:hypothetical protein L6452_01169 [Arctium lappa]
MYRPSPVRNQRSKGIKIKHVLQVCLLVAVCFWLIFQVKRSHDKKQEFDGSDPKISSSTHSQSSDEIIKLGRKDLQPKLEETTKEVEIHEEVEEQEEQEQAEHEDSKHEVEDQDEDKIEEEKEDERGGADDEIDENEQEKIEVEIDREDMNTMDEDKETEESEEKESDGQNQTENGGSLDDHDEDGSTVHTHEAREEHYKADDASSAVTNENGNGTLDNSNGNVGLVDNDQTAKNGPPSNTTTIQEISLNSTESIDAHENEPPANTTVTTTNSTQSQNVTEGVTDYISEVLKSNESNSSKTEVENDAGEGENLETKNETEGTEETLDSYETKPEDLDQNETIDSGDPSHLEEKEVRTDLETLPEIETEGGNSEDTAAE